jgi:hypothetical protein
VNFEHQNVDYLGVYTKSKIRHYDHQTLRIGTFLGKKKSIENDFAEKMKC